MPPQWRNERGRANDANFKKTGKTPKARNESYDK